MVGEPNYTKGRSRQCTSHTTNKQKQQNKTENPSKDALDKAENCSN